MPLVRYICPHIYQAWSPGHLPRVCHYQTEFEPEFIDHLIGSHFWNRRQAEKEAQNQADHWNEAQGLLNAEGQPKADTPKEQK